MSATRTVVCAMFALAASTIFAQNATVSGTITDPSGAAVVGAAVTAVNVDTGVGVSQDLVLRDRRHRHLADRHAAQAILGHGVALNRRVRVVEDDPFMSRARDGVAGDERFGPAHRVRELDTHAVGAASGAHLE